jgi:hypothetical protein
VERLCPMDEKLFSEWNNNRKMETNRWFDSAFQNFINIEIMGTSGIRR